MLGMQTVTTTTTGPSGQTVWLWVQERIPGGVVGAIIILIVGWLIARLLQAIVTAAVRRTRLDRRFKWRQLRRIQFGGIGLKARHAGLAEEGEMFFREVHPEYLPVAAGGVLVLSDDRGNAQPVGRLKRDVESLAESGVDAATRGAVYREQGRTRLEPSVEDRTSI